MCLSQIDAVEPRATIVRWTAETDLPGQGIEGSMNISAIQPIAPARDEQIRRDRSACPMTIAPGDIVVEHLTRRGMQRHQTRFAELGATDRQHRSLEIDILKLKIACFAETQARNAQ